MPARVQVSSLAPGIVLDYLRGGAVFGATVEVFSPNTRNYVTIYRDLTGGNTLHQPLRTDHLGEVPGYLSPMQVVDISVNGGPVRQVQVPSGTPSLTDLADGAYWEDQILSGGPSVGWITVNGIGPNQADSASNSAAIAAAIAQAQTLKRMIRLPAGDVWINQPFPMLGNCRGVIGAGREVTTIRIDSSAVNPYFGPGQTGFTGTTPPAPTAARAAGAGLSVGTYRYRIVYEWVFTSGGRTSTLRSFAGPAAVVTTTSGNQQVQLTNVPLGTGGGFTTARRVYRSPVGGAAGSEVYLGSINDNTTTTFTDSTPDSGLSATPVPVVSGFGRPMVIDPCGSDPTQNYTYPPHQIEGFSIMGDTDPYGPGNQGSMWQIDGVRCGSLDTIRDVSVSGVYAGVTIQGDHNNLYNVWSQVNAIGLRHTAPNPSDLGNNTFIACKFDSQCLASVSVAAGSTSQGDLYSQSHLGFAPYGFYKEGVTVGVHGNQPLGEQFIDSSVFEMCFGEAIGNGFIYDPLATAIVSDNVFVGMQGCGFNPLNVGQTDVRAGNAHSIQTAPADWVVYCGGFVENRIVGGGMNPFGPGNQGIFFAWTYFFDFYHDLARFAIDAINQNNVTLGYAAGDYRNQVYAACNTWGSMTDVRCRYNDTECYVLPCTTPTIPGDVVFYSSVSASAGCSRSSGGVVAQPVAGVALCTSSNHYALSAIPVVKEGFASVNLKAGLTLSTAALPGGWLKPTPSASDGTATVAQNQADYSIGYWTGGQTGQQATLSVRLSSGGALLVPPPIVNFGSGSDGTVDLDGTVTVPWATKSGNNYTMTRDIFCQDLTIDGPCVLFNNGFRIFVAGTLTVNGLIQAPVGAVLNDFGGGAAGGAISTAGANATNALGGAGGASSTAKAGGTATLPTVGNGGASPSPAQMINPAVTYMGGAGGGGSGSHAGGAGGGVVAIFARTVVNNNSIGAPGETATSGAGGGGGGVVYVASVSYSGAGTLYVSGGAGGGSGAAAGAVGSAIQVVCTSFADVGAFPTLVVANTLSVSTTLVAGDHNPIDATAAVRTATLPVPSGGGQVVSVEKTDASSNAVNITGSIRGVGASTLALTLQHEQVMLISDKTGSWWPIAGHKTLSSLDARYGQAQWKPYVRSMTQVGGSGVTAGSTIYLFDVFYPSVATFTTAGSAFGAVKIDPADLSASGSITLRIRNTVIPNQVAPACDVTFQLCKVTGWDVGAGASGAQPAVTSETGFLVQQTITAATIAAALTQMEAGTGDPPSSDMTYVLNTAGYYVFVIKTSATPAAGSVSFAQLEVDYK